MRRCRYSPALGVVLAVGCSDAAKDTERPDPSIAIAGAAGTVPLPVDAGGAGGSPLPASSAGGSGAATSGGQGGVALPGSGGTSGGGMTGSGGAPAGMGGSLPTCGATSHLPRCEEYTRHTCALCNPGGCDESQLCYALSSCDSLYSSCMSHFECALTATTCAAFEGCPRCEL